MDIEERGRVFHEHGDATKSCGKLLSKWLQGHNNRNDSCPRTLMEVMRDAHLGELADKLESFT